MPIRREERTVQIVAFRVGGFYQRLIGARAVPLYRFGGDVVVVGNGLAVEKSALNSAAFAHGFDHHIGIACAIGIGNAPSDSAHIRQPAVGHCRVEEGVAIAVVRADDAVLIVVSRHARFVLIIVFASHGCQIFPVSVGVAQVAACDVVIVDCARGLIPLQKYIVGIVAFRCVERGYAGGFGVVEVIARNHMPQFIAVFQQTVRVVHLNFVDIFCTRHFGFHAHGAEVTAVALAHKFACRYQPRGGVVLPIGNGYTPQCELRCAVPEVFAVLFFGAQSYVHIVRFGKVAGFGKFAACVVESEQFGVFLNAVVANPLVPCAAPVNGACALHTVVNRQRRIDRIGKCRIYRVDIFVSADTLLQGDQCQCFATGKVAVVGALHLKHIGGNHIFVVGIFQRPFQLRIACVGSAVGAHVVRYFEVVNPMECRNVNFARLHLGIGGAAIAHHAKNSVERLLHRVGRHHHDASRTVGRGYGSAFFAVQHWRVFSGRLIDHIRHHQLAKSTMTTPVHIAKHRIVEHRRLQRIHFVRTQIPIVRPRFTCFASIHYVGIDVVCFARKCGRRIPIELQIGGAVALTSTRQIAFPLRILLQRYFAALGRIGYHYGTIECLYRSPTAIVVVGVFAVVAFVVQHIVGSAIYFGLNVRSIGSPVVLKRTCGKNQHFHMHIALTERIGTEIARFFEPCVVCQCRYTHQQGSHCEKKFVFHIRSLILIFNGLKGVV